MNGRKELRNAKSTQTKCSHKISKEDSYLQTQNTDTISQMQQKNTKYEQKKQTLHKHRLTNTQTRQKKFQNAETTNKPKNSYTTNDKKQ